MDITQEAFIKTYEHLRSVKDETKFSNWFYKLLLQLVYQNSRRKKYRKTQNLPDSIGDETGEKEMNKLMIKDAIKNIPDEIGLVITLRFYRGMSCEEIARHLGEPTGTITSRLHRGYQLLKEKLQ